MFPIPFQSLQAGNLDAVFGFFITSWVVMGAPAVPAIFGLRFLIRQLRVYRFGFYKWLVFRPILLSVPLIGLLFGLATGYFDAWTYRDCYKPDHKVDWYEVFGIFGGPGDVMANSYAGDWQDDEAWDFRSDISVWNGLFWTTVAMMVVLMIRGDELIKAKFG